MEKNKNIIGPPPPPPPLQKKKKMKNENEKKKQTKQTNKQRSNKQKPTKKNQQKTTTTTTTTKQSKEAPKQCVILFINVTDVEKNNHGKDKIESKTKGPHLLWICCHTGLRQLKYHHIHTETR